MEKTAQQRVIDSVKEIMPKTVKTCFWLIKITVSISFGILFLKYFEILPWFSNLISPLFNLVGLPGEASLAYVSGYFVNVYSAIAVMATLDLDVRSITILSAMVLAAHNMITETAVQKKTGSSATRIVIIRTLSSVVLGVALNWLIPGSHAISSSTVTTQELSLTTMLQEWFVSTLWLIVKMTVLIFSLSIMQRLLSEFGVIKWISKFLRPFMAIFGLPAKTSFLWIVANILGLAYGAAVMMEETDSGKISREDADLLNHHIAISHSNLEDLLLLSSIGGIFLWLLLPRLLMSMILVWELRLEMAIRKKVVALQLDSNPK